MVSTKVGDRLGSPCADNLFNFFYLIKRNFKEKNKYIRVIFIILQTLLKGIMKIPKHYLELYFSFVVITNKFQCFFK